MNLLDLEFLATGSEPYRYPLASGPEGVTLEGRKMAMAGNRGFVNKTRSMPTLLNVTKISASLFHHLVPQECINIRIRVAQCF